MDILENQAMDTRIQLAMVCYSPDFVSPTVSESELTLYLCAGIHSGPVSTQSLSVQLTVWCLKLPTEEPHHCQVKTPSLAPKS